ncbi:MAG TPA: amidohydrolase family protein [Rariglobus sp.]
MSVDIHVHLAGLGANGNGNVMAPVFRRSFAFRQFARRVGLTREMLDAPDPDRAIARRIVGWIEASGLERAVLLALDGAYRDDGTPDDAHTRLATANDFVADIARESPRTLFGASVHPYRRDALEELERLAARGAVLIKWLPGAQNIRPDDPRCFPFYETMARLGLPLLCHTGNEHTLQVFPDAFNDPVRLIPALERGVTVIAAHCGARLYLHERSYLPAWQALALRHERLFGDISAFGVVTRMRALRRLLHAPGLAGKLVYGSDFPVAPLPLSCLGWISVRQALALRRIANPFDLNVALMKALGVPDAVFSRAGKLLRLPSTHASANRPVTA